jgi:hypothetical protein
LFNNLVHLGDLFLNTSPRELLPLTNLIIDFLVKRIELIEEVKLLRGFLKVGVLLVGKTEEGLTSIVRFESSISDVKLFSEHSKSVKSFTRSNTFDSGTRLIKVSLEVSDILSEEADTLDEISLEIGLTSHKLISDLASLLDKLLPVSVKDLLRVDLLLLHDLRDVDLKNSVHVNDRSEADLNVGLFGTDLLEGVHDVTKGINVLSGLLDLQLDVLHVVLERLNLRGSLSEEILSIGGFPLRDPLSKTSLN